MAHRMGLVVVGGGLGVFRLVALRAPRSPVLRTGSLWNDHDSCMLSN